MSKDSDAITASRAAIRASASTIASDASYLTDELDPRTIARRALTPARLRIVGAVAGAAVVGLIVVRALRR